jgi:hypothetical protein
MKVAGARLKVMTEKPKVRVRVVKTKPQVKVKVLVRVRVRVRVSKDEVKTLLLRIRKETKDRPCFGLWPSHHNFHLSFLLSFSFPYSSLPFFSFTKVSKLS